MDEINSLLAWFEGRDERLFCPDYLNSRDAQANVIKKFDGKQKWEMHKQLLIIWQTLPLSMRPPNYTEWLLIVDACVIAEILYHVVKESGK